MKLSKLALIPLTFLAVTPIFSQTAVSVSGGDAKTSSTWDCGCVPDATYDLIIDHAIAISVGATYKSMHIRNGGSFETAVSGTVGVLNDLVVDAGGVLITNRFAFVMGDFVLNGTWGGSNSLDLRGSGTNVSGTGTITNPATLYFRGGDKTILPGTVLNKAAGIINVNNVRVFNDGSVRVSVLSSSGAARWINRANSRVEFVSVISGSIRLIALAPGNTVAFTRDATNQDIRASHLNTFHHLELSSNGAWRKTMQNDLIIKGDLTMNECLLETRKSGSDKDITITGNWTASKANMIPRTGTVNFDHVTDISITTDTEEFFNVLNLNGTGTVTQVGDVTVVGTLTSEVDLIMDDDAPRTLSVGGDFLNLGSFTHNGGKVVMNGSGSQLLEGEFVYQDLTIDNSGGDVSMTNGDHAIHGTLDIMNGQLATNDRLTMISDANGDSRIAAINNGSVVGEVVAERYIDAGATNWRFLTSPTQGNTVGDWTDDFSTSGFVGSTYPTFSFTSVYFHDESAPGTLDDGFVAATNVTNPIDPGAGIWVWSGDNLNGTSDFTIDVEGEIYQGDVSLPVTYTSYGDAPNDGWNMVANPYISAIDWDSPEWNKVGINDAIYIWVPELEQFASYVGGVSVNGGSRYIASSQAFWVQTNSPGAQLVAREGIKSDQAIGFRGPAQTLPPDILRIALSKNGLRDELLLRYEGAASADFDVQFDAVERMSANDDSPNFHSVSADGQKLMINSFARANADTTIQLAFEVNQPGTYTIDFSEITGSFSNSCIILEDQVTGEQTAVSAGTSIAISLTPGQNEDRFLLRIAGGIEYFEIATSCPGESDGMVVAQATGAGPHDYTWYDDASTVIRTATGVIGPDTLTDVPMGAYSVSVELASPCGVVSVSTFVADPAVITTNEVITASACSGINDGAVDLNISGGAAPYAVQWAHGPTTSSIGQLAAGTYDVTITDGNGCSASHSLVVSEDFAVVAAISAPVVANEDQPVIFQSNSVGAVSMDWDMGDGTLFQSVSAPVHVYENAGSYTVTLTVQNNNCVDVTSHEIDVRSVASTVHDVLTPIAAGVRFVQQGGQLFVFVEGTESRDLQVIVSNLVGQQVITPITGAFAPGKTAIDLGGNRNHIVVAVAIDVTTGERWGSRIAF